MCVKNDWHSIVNYIEQYVNITVKSKLNIYDADKTGMVDYALESAGNIIKQHLIQLKYKFADTR